MSIDLSARIANLEINPAIMNSSGILSFLPVLYRFSDNLGAVLLKSIEYHERPGNETPIFVDKINAVGLSGQGYEKLKEEIEEYNQKFPNKFNSLKSRVKVGISLFEDSPEKLAYLVQNLDSCCDFFEINFSCPNLIGEEKIGIEIGKDPELIRLYTYAARKATNKIIIPKLSPAPYIYDRKKFPDIARAAEDGGADAISAINTMPGGMKIDIYAKRPVLNAKFGGVSGPEIKPFGVGCIYTLYESVKIPIIGVGGIENAEDIVEYVEAGASAVQIGTELVEENLRTTTKEINKYLFNLVKNLEKLLQELNANSLKELVGVCPKQNMKSSL